jgi:RimJ/RimL family protein N-acetyltransferase
VTSSSHAVNINHHTSGAKSLRAPAASARVGEKLVLADGTTLLLRPLSRDDRDEMLGLFERLSDESRWRRYLSPKPSLSPRELDYFTDIDHVTHEAFAAVDERDGSFAGVARYVRHAGTEPIAELAVEVADEMQRRGIGTALCDCVIERAQINGLRLLTGTTLWNNHAARSLLRGLGFQTRRSQGREIELELALEASAA